jgi:hypothetical protein
MDKISSISIQRDREATIHGKVNFLFEKVVPKP